MNDTEMFHHIIKETIGHPLTFDAWHNGSMTFEEKVECFKSWIRWAEENPGENTVQQRLNELRVWINYPLAIEDAYGKENVILVDSLTMKMDVEDSK